MGVPYELNPPVGGITIPATKTQVVVGIAVPSRVRIHKVYVARTDTPGSGTFSVDLYNLEAAANGSSITDANGNTLDARLFKIMPTQAGANGFLAYHADTDTGGFGFPFYSQDPNFSNTAVDVSTPVAPADKSQVNTRMIWVVISGAVAGQVFCINIGVETDLI